MIGILFLLGIIFWLAMALMLSKRIPRWVGIRMHATAVSVLLFPLVFAAPIADELIGRWQFYRLCEREAVVSLSPDWVKVKRARKRETQWTELHGNLVPVRLAKIDTLDVDTGSVFMTSRSLFTDGGFLSRHLIGLSGVTSCPPKNIQAIQEQVNLFELLK
jgi:hypothetical protein